MSYNYTQFVASIANLMPTLASDANFLTDLPNIIDEAEQRIYRELDLLNTIVRDSSSTFTTGTRTFNLPGSIGTYVTTDSFNVITPAGTSNPDSGTRNPLTPVSRSWLDFTYPSSSGSTVPAYIAPLTQTSFVVGPWPDAAYTVEVTGNQRPAPLSASNVTTILTTYLPDLFMAAAMSRVAAYMKNYGAQTDDPRMAQSWESKFQELKQSAAIEEARKRFTSEGWSSKSPSPLATPPRT